MLIESIIKKVITKSSKKLVATKPDEDFFPYVCHYDPSTILTKNGELLQIIRITGFSGESSSSDLITLRDTLRDSIAENIKESKFALWFHTIRRKKNIVPKGEYSDFLSERIHQDWVKKNKWDEQYVNELYITIITEGFDTSIQNMHAFSRSFSRKATFGLHTKFLAESFKSLSRVSLSILADIEDYGAKLLNISEWDGVLYSEPMRFFGKIANLYEDRYPLAANDISNDLATHKIAFGNRELEVSGPNNKNFAAMLSIKEYHEVSTDALERILQLPFEFIISQSFDFSVNKKDIEEQQYQDQILRISGDNDFRNLSGIGDFIASDTNSETDYCRIQSSVMLINSSKEVLEKDISSLVEKFSTLGFILVREDIFSEHCFWSQLPGNFAFLRRQKIINTARIAGFAALHNFPAGSIDGNHWGPAITTLKTVLKTPYFFNFHDKDLGHSLVIGPKDSGKTTVTNFLLTEAHKLNNKIFYFDSNQSSKVFVEGLAGQNHILTKDINNPQFLQLNPFSLPKNQENEAFLVSWIKELVVFLKGEVPENEVALIPEIIKQVCATASPSFLTAFDAFANKTPALYEKLKIWGAGKLGYIFGSQNEIDWKNPVHSFDLSEIINQKPVLIPVISYLMQRIEANLDEKPAIVVFDEAWDLLDNAIMAPKLEQFLQRLRKKNCIVIFLTTNNDEIDDSAITKTIKENTAAQLYLSNPTPQEYYKTIFDLNEEEFDILKMMEEKDRNFLLKHRGDSIIIDLDLRSFAETLQILSADSVTIAAMEEIISSYKAKNSGSNPTAKDWIPQLVEVAKEIEQEKRAAAIQKMREAKAQERKNEET